MSRAEAIMPVIAAQASPGKVGGEAMPELRFVFMAV
jgi:hypothetical protein